MLKGLLLVLLLASASFAWWDASFPYRMPINITSSAPLTDYQVQVSPNIYNNTGLVGSWHFSEGAGTRAADSSGLNNDGTLTSFDWTANSNWTAGKFGGGLKFDGLNDYVSIPDSDAFTFANASGDLPFSVEAWIKPNAVDAVTLVSKRTSDPSNFEWQLAIQESNQLGLLVWDPSAGRGAGRAYNVPLAAGNWYHVVGTYAGTGGSSANARAGIRVYVNGTAMDNVDTSAGGLTGYNKMQNTAASVAIGRLLSGIHFNGIIDEVRIYNRSLSAQEIADHYNATKARLDYADLRFALANDTQIPYWLENDKSAWVKVPSVPAGNSAIYMYYGNSSAVSASNGTATFDVFDGFEGYSIGSTGAPAWTVNAAGFTVQSDGTQVLKKGGTESGAKSTRPVAQTNISVDMRLKHLDSLFYTQPLIGDASTYYSLIVGASGMGLAIYDPNSGVMATIALTAVQGVWYDVSLARNGSTLTGKGGGKTVTWTGMSISSLNAGLRIGGTQTGAIDDFRVRKYNSPEPTAAAGAEEQADVTPPLILIQSPNASVSYSSLLVPLYFTATDASGVSQCKYELNGVNATLAVCANATLTASSGSNSLVVWAYDGTNWGSAPLSFNVTLSSSVSNYTTTDSNGIGNVSLSSIPPGASRIAYSVGSNSYSRSFSVSAGVSSVRISARASLQGTPASGKSISFELS